MELIFKPELKNNRGTLIYALGELECEKYIYQLLPLLYEENYEVVMNKIDYYEDVLSRLCDVYVF